MKKIVKPLIIGNWKTTPATLKEALTFVKSLEKKCGAMKQKVHYYLAVADIFIPPLSALASHGEIGSQNISGTILGQATGLTTPSQIVSGGGAFTLLGHSEVRTRGESTDLLAKKVALSLQSKLLTVLCVGETTRDKEGKYLAELEDELKNTLAQVDRSLFANLVIAYEPVWAIGAKNPATVHECFEVVIALRRALASLVGIEYAKKVSIIYGGAVSEENAREFLEEGGVDGLLLGRSSQEVSSFSKILSSCFA
jgi:triosephosphate isomerase